MHTNLLGILFKMQVLIQWVWSGAQDAFLMSSYSGKALEKFHGLNDLDLKALTFGRRERVTARNKDYERVVQTW